MCDRYSSGARDTLSNCDIVTVPDDLELSDSDPEDQPTSIPLDSVVKELNSASDDDDDDEDIQAVQTSGVPGGQPSPSAPQSNFSLKGGSTDFSNRSRSIFDCLDGVAKETSSKLGQDNVIDGVFARPPPPPPLSSVKKPAEPGERKRHVTEGSGEPVKVRRATPDYLVHPERWTRYSLEDVPELSDSRNSSVALQYLLSLQQRKEPPAPEEERFIPDQGCGQGAESGECSVRGSQRKIVFSRPSSATGKEQPVDELKAAGGRREGKKGGLSHLEEEEGDEAEEEEKETSVVAVPHKAEQGKRQWRHGGGGADEEDEEENEPEVQPGFVSFRKANRKNYRKTSKQEDD